MKKTISLIVIFSLLFYMLLAPSLAVSAAADGLLLWYKTILPTLLPFAILSNVFILSNLFYLICRVLHPFVRFFFPISKEGTFPLAAGFLFGFPMGSRICASMVLEGKLARQEASILFIISNNMSPMFIFSYILEDSLHLPQLVPGTILSLYVPPLLLGGFLLSRQKKCCQSRECRIPKEYCEPAQKNTASGFHLNYKILDAAIMNGFDALVKLGGYIMLFSILASMFRLLPISSELIKSGCIGIVEITNGIQAVSTAGLSSGTKYILCVTLTAFGGLSGIAQTSSMTSESQLPIRNYILAKLFLAACSGLLASLFV